MFLAMIYYALFLTCRWITLHFFGSEKSCNQKIVPWFRSHNIEATSIRFIMEGNIEILFCAIIAILQVKESRSIGPKFADMLSNLLAFLMLIVLSYAPIHALLRAIQFNRLKSQ